MSDQTHITLPNIAFIVGMGRSGTTMLTSMLNMNGEIISTPENEFILFSESSFSKKDFNKPTTLDLFCRMFDYNFNNVINIWKPLNLKSSVEKLSHKNYADVCKLVYLSYPLAHKEIAHVNWVVDKNPSYSLHISLLHKLYPQAKYIILSRDYRDNILSRRTYSDKGSSLYKLAAAWNYYYDEIFKAVSKYNLSAHVIRYEDLVQDPEKALTHLCGFLDVKFDSEMLNFQDFSKAIKQHAKTTLSESKFDKVSNMHSNLEKVVNTDRMDAYKKELSAADIDLLDAFCGKQGAKFGYPVFNKHPRPQSFSSVVRYQMALFQVILYSLLSKFYYSLPVSFRLRFKKKSL